MALTSTLYRFRIDVSDVDRNVYEGIDFRVAMHPSETTIYLMTRVLAFALNFQPGLIFNTGGLSDSDQPGLSVNEPRGGYKLWIEIGSPSPRKLHKAAKVAETVKVYTYKDPEILMAEIGSGGVHRADEIEVYSFDPTVLENLGAGIAKDNSWSLLHNDGLLTITGDGLSLETEIRAIQLLGR